MSGSESSPTKADLLEVESTMVLVLTEVVI